MQRSRRRPLRPVARLTVARLTVAVLAVATLSGCSIGTGTERTGSDRPVPAVTRTPAPTATPAGTAPATRSFGVGVRQLKLNRGGDRPLPVTVWYPATGRATGTPRPGAKVADGRFPVVLFSHGLTGAPADYLSLLRDWPGAGFVVVAPTYPHTSKNAPDFQVLDVVNQPADASYVLDEVLALDTRAGDPFRGRLDTDRVAAAGHSAGGITTVGLFTVNRDKRLDAGIVFAGSLLGMGSTFTGATAPMLFVHGQLDEVVSYASGKAAYDQVPWPKAMLTLPKGDHGRSLLGRDDRALRLVGDVTLEFLRWSLYGDPTARSRLADRATRDGLAVLDDRL